MLRARYAAGERRGCGERRHAGRTRPKRAVRWHCGPFRVRRSSWVAVRMTARRRSVPPSFHAEGRKAKPGPARAAAGSSPMLPWPLRVDAWHRVHDETLLTDADLIGPVPPRRGCGQPAWRSGFRIAGIGEQAALVQRQQLGAIEARHHEDAVAANTSLMTSALRSADCRGRTGSLGSPTMLTTMHVRFPSDQGKRGIARSSRSRPTARSSHTASMPSNVPSIPAWSMIVCVVVPGPNR